MGAESETAVAAEIRRYLADTSGRPLQEILDSEPLLDGLLDSIGLLSLAAHLEERYGIAIGAGEVDPGNFGTLTALSAFVARKAGAA